MWVPDHLKQCAAEALQSAGCALAPPPIDSPQAVLASAIPSAAVLLIGWAPGRPQPLALGADPAMAFYELRNGAVLGTLLALTFADDHRARGAALPDQAHPALSRVMARAELATSSSAPACRPRRAGKLARSFNTMLARVTDMAVADIETKESMAKLEADLSLQSELKAVKRAAGGPRVEMELLLEVSKAVSGTLDLPEQLETLGRHVCDRLGISEFS